MNAPSDFIQCSGRDARVDDITGAQVFVNVKYVTHANAAHEQREGMSFV